VKSAGAASTTGIDVSPNTCPSRFYFEHSVLLAGDAIRHDRIHLPGRYRHDWGGHAIHQQPHTGNLGSQLPVRELAIRQIRQSIPVNGNNLTWSHATAQGRRRISYRDHINRLSDRNELGHQIHGSLHGHRQRIHLAVTAAPPQENDKPA
jgi:hypothetical protein